VSAVSTADEDEEVRVLNAGGMHEKEVDSDFEGELAALVSEHQGLGEAFSATQQVSPAANCSKMYYNYIVQDHACAWQQSNDLGHLSGGCMNSLLLLPASAKTIAENCYWC
jgi:hypothetical protein